MESLNQSLFLMINASAHPPAALVALARLLAEDLVWALPIGFLLIWLRGSVTRRQVLFDAGIAATLALAIGAIIGLVWLQPRPFALGLGHRLIDHVADASFPSDHLTLIWAVAATWTLRRTWRAPGLALLGIGITVAWARMYVGVHFPLDMAGALGVAWLSAVVTLNAQTAVAPLFAASERLRECALRPAIAAGWVRV